MTKTATMLTGIDGREFAAVVLTEGDTYGLSGALTCGKKALIEIYDYSQDHEVFGEYGQFTGGRYYAKTLAADKGDYELCLDGGNADVWTLTAESTATLTKLAQEVCNA